MSTLIVNPSGYDESRSAWRDVTNLENAYNSTENTNRATFALKTGSALTYIYLTFDLSSIPANATINSVSCNAKGYIDKQNAARIEEKQVQLFSGIEAKGTAITMPTSSASSIAQLDTGTWTREELDNLTLRFYAKRGYSGTSNNYNIYIYGADLTIEYTSGGVTQTLKIKSNGNWQDVSKVYKKENGEWIEQTELSQVFDTQKNYLKES